VTRVSCPLLMMVSPSAQPGGAVRADEESHVLRRSRQAPAKIASDTSRSDYQTLLQELPFNPVGHGVDRRDGCEHEGEHRHAPEPC